MTSTPWRISSRLTVLIALSCPSQIGTAVRMRTGVVILDCGFWIADWETRGQLNPQSPVQIPKSFPSPNHRDARRQAAAHVEGHDRPRTRHLALAGFLI